MHASEEFGKLASACVILHPRGGFLHDLLVHFDFGGDGGWGLGDLLLPLDFFQALKWFRKPVVYPMRAETTNENTQVTQK